MKNCTDSKNLTKFFDELIARNKPVTIEEFMALFHEAVDYGVKFDQSINKMIDFETLLLDRKNERIEVDPKYEDAYLSEEYEDITGQLGDPATMSCHTSTWPTRSNEKESTIHRVSIRPPQPGDDPSDYTWEVKTF